MFVARRKFAEAVCTSPVTFLPIAFILCPVLLAASSPHSYLSVSVANALGVLCIALAWSTWKRSPHLAACSIEIPDVRSK